MDPCTLDRPMDRAGWPGSWPPSGPWSGRFMLWPAPRPIPHDFAGPRSAPGMEQAAAPWPFRPLLNWSDPWTVYVAFGKI